MKVYRSGDLIGYQELKEKMEEWNGKPEQLSVTVTYLLSKKADQGKAIGYVRKE